MHVEVEEEEEEKEALTAKVLYWGSVSGSMKKEREQQRAREAVWKDDRPHYQQSSDSDASAFVHIFVFVLVRVCIFFLKRCVSCHASKSPFACMWVCSCVSLWAFQREG